MAGVEFETSPEMARKVRWKHRFGGHGGLPTEWEIVTPDLLLKRIICALPRVAGVFMSDPTMTDSYSAFIMLPQGCSFDEVEPVIDSLVVMEPASDAILAAIEKAAAAAGYEVSVGGGPVSSSRSSEKAG